MRNTKSTDRPDTAEHHTDVIRDDDYRGAEARDRFGGTNWGAAFFGWLVSVAMAILLTSIVGAVAAAIGASGQVTQTQAERSAGTIGLMAAAVLLVIMLIAYYTGGYVAGRMSRFDGGRQGLAVWLIGLLVTLVAVALGVIFGSQYNLLDRVNLPRMPIPTDQLGIGGIATAVIVLAGTLITTMAGAKVGQRYHNTVDRAVDGR